jgi:peptidoglycan/LPS O-acetylase OafA/YrhL
MFVLIGRHPAFLCLSYFSVGIIAYEMRRLTLPKNIVLLAILFVSSKLMGRPSLLIILTLIVVLLNILFSSWFSRKTITALKIEIENVTYYLGDLTYGIYLWHIPVQMFLIIIIRRADAQISSNLLVYIIFAWIVLTMLLSALSFQYFEKPLKRRIIKHLSK